MRDFDHWAEVASEWIAWARTPGHDSFWAYRAALGAFVGAGSGAALDVGCGEGRIARDLTALGYRVTAADPVPALLAAAEAARSAEAYVLAPATALPLPDASFDLVVAYNVLMDLEDVPGAVREMCRVLKPDGRLVVSICHPIADAGAFDGHGPDAPFTLRRSYFGREHVEDVETREGLRMRFAGWSQPFEAYAAALEAAGLAITALREPQPDTSMAPERRARWTRVPLFLWLSARPLS